MAVRQPFVALYGIIKDSFDNIKEENYHLAKMKL